MAVWRLNHTWCGPILTNKLACIITTKGANQLPKDPAVERSVSAANDTVPIPMALFCELGNRVFNCIRR
jgi:hypothetical protein